MKKILTDLSRALEALSTACEDASDTGTQKLESAVDQLSYCIKTLQQTPQTEVNALNIELHQLLTQLATLLGKVETEKEAVREEAKNLMKRLQAQKSYAQGASHT